MKRSILFFAAVLVFAALATTCNNATVPMMIKDESGRVVLTPPYAYPYDILGEAAKVTADGKPLEVRVAPVNPEGVGIKAVYKASDGSTHVELNGTVSPYRSDGLGGSQNGIPEGLHKIVMSLTAVPPYTGTDYPIPSLPIIDGAIQSPVYTYNGAALDVPLETMISLRALYDNPAYTAVTISGLAKSQRVWIREKNDSLLLFTKQTIAPYGQFTTVFDSASVPAYRTGSSFNINNFTREGQDISYPGQAAMPLRGSSTPRGSGEYEGGGGYNVLIWDGANLRGAKKQAQMDFSYDIERRRWEKTVVDWTDVKFAAVPLQYMAWYVSAGIYYPNQNVYFKGTAPYIEKTELDAGVYKTFTLSIDGTKLLLPPVDVDNFLIPSFYPANSTEKKVYLTEKNAPIDPTFGGTKLTELAFDPDGNPLTGALFDSEGIPLYSYIVEIYDRIRIRKGIPATADTTVNIYCDTKPPKDNSSVDSPVVTIKLALTITAT